MEVKILGNPKEMVAPYTQQGDCLVKKCGTKGVFIQEFEGIPKEARPTGSNLVLQGQSNSHALYGGAFTVLEHGSRIFVKVDETTVLDHVRDLRTGSKAEHFAHYIPPGEYFIDPVQEYNHLTEESKALVD